MNRSIALVAGLAAALPAAAAMAPQFRWQLEFPAFVLESDRAAQGLTLRSLELDMRCAGACMLTSVYTLSGAARRQARLVLPAAAEPAPRIEAEGASARIGDVRAPVRAPSPPSTPAPVAPGVEPMPPRGRADVATRTIDVAFTGDAARITVVQRLPPSVRGAGTDLAMAVMRVDSAALGSWPQAPGFELSLRFSAEPDPHAARPGSFACLRYDDAQEAKLLVRGTQSAVAQRVRLASPLPRSVACLIGSEAVIARELR